MTQLCILLRTRSNFVKNPKEETQPQLGKLEYQTFRKRYMKTPISFISFWKVRNLAKTVWRNGCSDTTKKKKQQRKQRNN